MSELAAETWQCSLCGHQYSAQEGDPGHGIAPGTPFDALPADWHCPECGMEKQFYERVEV